MLIRPAQQNFGSPPASIRFQAAKPTYGNDTFAYRFYPADPQIQGLPEATLWEMRQPLADLHAQIKETPRAERAPLMAKLQALRSDPTIQSTVQALMWQNQGLFYKNFPTKEFRQFPEGYDKASIMFWRTVEGYDSKQARFSTYFTNSAKKIKQPQATPKYKKPPESRYAKVHYTNEQGDACEFEADRLDGKVLRDYQRAQQKEKGPETRRIQNMTELLPEVGRKLHLRTRLIAAHRLQYPAILPETVTLNELKTALEAKTPNFVVQHFLAQFTETVRQEIATKPFKRVSPKTLLRGVRTRQIEESKPTNALFHFLESHRGKKLGIWKNKKEASTLSQLDQTLNPITPSAFIETFLAQFPAAKQEQIAEQAFSTNFSFDFEKDLDANKPGFLATVKNKRILFTKGTQELLAVLKNLFEIEIIGDPTPLSKLGKRFGLTQERIRQISTKAFLTVQHAVYEKDKSRTHKAPL